MLDIENSHQQTEWFRQRQLLLTSPCAEQLLQQLRDTDGVIEVRQEQDKLLFIHYELRHTSLYQLEKIIRAHDHAFAASTLHNIKRAIYRYTEHIQIKNRVLDTGWDVWVRDAYLNFYRNRQHGRRDLRVQQWRKYVKDKEPQNKP